MNANGAALEKETGANDALNLVVAFISRETGLVGVILRTAKPIVTRENNVLVAVCLKYFQGRFLVGASLEDKKKPHDRQ